MNVSDSSSFVATRLRGVLVGLVSLGFSACGGSSDPVNFNGTYTTTLTNSDNGCQLANWKANEVTENVQIVATTDPLNTKSVLVKVEGLTGAWLELVVGSRMFISTSDGNALSGVLLGRESTDKGCMQTIRIRLNATLKTDTLEGTLTYGFDVKNPEACGIKATCTNQQTLKGLRPPLPTK
jgi:hypothetical protein